MPEEIETEYLLAKNLLDKGVNVKRDWDIVIGDVEEQYDAAVENTSLYNAIVAMEKLSDISISRYFMDNGYDFDEVSKENLQSLKSAIVKFIDDNIASYVANMYCKSIEGMNTFRNHNTKIQNKLSALGFQTYANMVERQKNKELENQEEIKSRQELRGDYSKYMELSKMDRFTSYIAIKDLLKDGKELLKRVEKYKLSLGKDGEKIQKALSDRLSVLDKAKTRIEQDIADIWDDLMEIKSADDIHELIERINLVLQKGISANDEEGLVEIKDNLSELLDDVNGLVATSLSRKEFLYKSKQIQVKYQDSEFDFEVLEIIDEVIAEIDQKLKTKENQWRNRHLSLGDRSRKSVHTWKAAIEVLPDYLSEDTLSEIALLDKEADELIKDGKIEDVLIYFEKLNDDEKSECIVKLCSSMNIQIVTKNN